MADKTVSLAEIMRFFGYGSKEAAKFRNEWAALSVTDKAQIKGGLANGTLTY